MKYYEKKGLPKGYTGFERGELYQDTVFYIVTTLITIFSFIFMFFVWVHAYQQIGCAWGREQIA